MLHENVLQATVFAAWKPPNPVSVRDFHDQVKNYWLENQMIISLIETNYYNIFHRNNLVLVEWSIVETHSLYYNDNL